MSDRNLTETMIRVNNGSVDELADRRLEAVRNRDAEDSGTSAFALFNGKVSAYNAAIKALDNNDVEKVRDELSKYQQRVSECEPGTPEFALYNGMCLAYRQALEEAYR